MTDSPLYGLILMGGQSTRMGTDKSLINYSGAPQREHLFTLVSTCCETVYTSCRKDQEVPANLNPLPDYYSFPGPINGILSAFHAHPHVSWLILAVDMPYVDDAALQLLLAHRNRNKMATCFLHAPQKFPEPLLTVWETSSHAPLLAFAHSGRASPKAFLEQADIQTVAPPDQKILLNVNYPGTPGLLL